jgi:hypothetical protein
VNLEKAKKRIQKKVKKGFQGYPMITIAHYGPNDKVATKVVVGFIAEENADIQLEKFSTVTDIRSDISVQTAMIKIIERSAAKSVISVSEISGCPHEEGIDYSEGEECESCDFWQGKDGFSGKIK